MSTITTGFTQTTNADISKENTRMLIAVDDKRNAAYRFYGDTDSTESYDEIIQDYHLPSRIASNELDGVLRNEDVTMSTSIPTQVSNFFVNTTNEAEVGYNVRGRAVAGQLGNLSEQEVKLRLRAMNIANLLLVSNRTSRIGTPQSRTDPYRAASTISFFGNGETNASNDDSVAENTRNPGLWSVSDNLNVTAAPGYNTSTKIAGAIVDATATIDREDLSIQDVIDIVAGIDRRLDSASGSKGTMGYRKDGTTRDQSYVCIVPTAQYNRMMATNNSGIMNLNRYTTSIGGQLKEIMADIMCIKTDYGKIMIVKETHYLGDTGTSHVNRLPFVTVGNATELVYQVRPYIQQLFYQKADDNAVCRQTISVRPPHADFGTVVVGCNQ